MKKIVSVFLASALAVSACAGLAGCSGDNKNYPVSVGRQGQPDLSDGPRADSTSEGRAPWQLQSQPEA